MKTQKMSLANIQGKLSRTEMKNIMAGSGSETVGWGTCCTASGDCGGITGCSQWNPCLQVFTKCST